MMADNDLLYKVSHNKRFLFIIPHLIYLYKLCYFYNCCNDYSGDILLSEVFFLALIFFVITTLQYLFLGKYLKDYQKTFCIICFSICFYFFKFSLVYFLIFIFLYLFLVFDFKKFINVKLDTFIGLVSCIIIVLFSYGFVQTVFNFSTMLLKTNNEDVSFEVEVDDNYDTPNIYYIHCDGMLSLGAMRSYFGYTNNYLNNYFIDNGYYHNMDAELVGGRKTQRALAAMFNPNYYDKVLKDFLIDLEDSYYEDKPVSSLVGYRKLEDKRLNSELFDALDKKKYTTFAIGEYNQYTSLDVDYYYDFYYFDSEWLHLIDGKDKLRYIKESNNDLKLSSYVDFLHFRNLLSNTMFHEVIDYVDYLDYKDIPYDDINLSDYEYISDSEYWPAKAILKGLDKSFELNDDKFVFIDYNLNHLSLTFDSNGNRLREEDMFNLRYYSGNYQYSTYLLVDILQFIHDNDPEAVIIVQGDHGIHMLEDSYIMNRISIDVTGLKKVRNSVISAMYIPNKYKNGDEKYLNNPLNIGRYLVNNYVGDNYKYLDYVL